MARWNGGRTVRRPLALLPLLALLRPTSASSSSSSLPAAASPQELAGGAVDSASVPRKMGEDTSSSTQQDTSSSTQQADQNEAVDMQSVLAALGFLSGTFLAVLLGLRLYLYCVRRRPQRESRRRKLTQTEIEQRFPVTKCKADETCVVCLSPIEAGDDCRVTQCGHSFHADCLMAWWLHKPRRILRCPICRTRQRFKDDKRGRKGSDEGVSEDGALGEAEEVGDAQNLALADAEAADRSGDDAPADQDPSSPESQGTTLKDLPHRRPPALEGPLQEALVEVASSEEQGGEGPLADIGIQVIVSPCKGEEGLEANREEEEESGGKVGLVALAGEDVERLRADIIYELREAHLVSV